VFLFSVLLHVGIVLLFYLMWINFTFSPPTFRVCVPDPHNILYCATQQCRSGGPEGGPGPKCVTIFFYFHPVRPLVGGGGRKISFTGARTRSRRPCPANVQAGIGKENKKCESIYCCDLIVTLRQNLPREIEENH
jgi:hypothetical protein